MARVAVKDTATRAGYLTRVGACQRTMIQANATMTGSCSRQNGSTAWLAYRAAGRQHGSRAAAGRCPAVPGLRREAVTAAPNPTMATSHAQPARPCSAPQPGGAPVIALVPAALSAAAQASKPPVAATAAARAGQRARANADSNRASPAIKNP